MSTISTEAPYTLHDDRTVEYGFVYKHLDRGNGQLLDLGAGPGYPTTKHARQLGWTTTAISLEGPRSHEGSGFVFVKGDFLSWNTSIVYDRVLNISTIEHFGLSGRYGVTENNSAADLVGMRRLKSCTNPEGWQLLTLPVGHQDQVFAPWHRIYGPSRLEELLVGWEILNQEFFAKSDGIDTYHRVLPRVAFSTVPQPPPDHYYAIGCFKLMRTK